MIKLEDFKFSHPIQMRWNDLDALGHVNNAVFITYFEVARGYYMIEAAKGWDWTKNMFLIGNAQVNYHKELLLTAQDPRVLMRTEKIGNKSFVLQYAVVSTVKGETVLHASGSTTQIMFDMKTRNTIEIPDWIRKELTAYEA